MSKFYVIYHNTETREPMIKEFLENEMSEMEKMVRELKETEHSMDVGDVLDKVICGNELPVKFEIKTELSIDYGRVRNG